MGFYSLCTKVFLIGSLCTKVNEKLDLIGPCLEFCYGYNLCSSCSLSLSQLFWSLLYIFITGQVGYASIYGELPEFKRNQISLVPSVPSERPWETIFSGSSHNLPPLTKLCAAFLESLMEKRTAAVEWFLTSSGSALFEGKMMGRECYTFDFIIPFLPPPQIYFDKTERVCIKIKKLYSWYADMILGIWHVWSPVGWNRKSISFVH